MAKHQKHKRPSGDVVEDDAVVVAPAIEPEPEVAAVVSDDSSEPKINVDLLDDNRRVIQRVAIKESDKSFRIHYDGKAWDHVADHADGTWQFTQV